MLCTVSMDAMAHVAMDNGVLSSAIARLLRLCIYKDDSGGSDLAVANVDRFEEPPRQLLVDLKLSPQGVQESAAGAFHSPIERARHTHQ